MTKQVRIENADTSSKGIIVEVWDIASVDGMITERLQETLNLYNPCSILTTYITGTRYLVIKESK